MNSWASLCVACKGYPQEHTHDEHCLLGPKTIGIGGNVVQLWSPDVAGRDISRTSDPGCEED